MMVRRSVIGLATVVAGLSISSLALAQVGKPPLTIVSWGGAFTRSQMLAYVLPYRELRDRWVNVEDYEGGLDQIRDQVASANVKWDLVSLELSDATAGCEEGLLEPIDHDILAPAPDGTLARQDFFDLALQPCAVGYDIFATVVAYDTRRYAEPPTTLADFFDVERFPGPRGLEARPQVNLEWALIADGVAPAEVYEVLSTEGGVERAFDVLSGIRDQVVWWRRGSEPPRLLSTGQVAMSSAWNGRIYEEVQARGTPLEIIWQHQVWNMGLWGIPKGAPNRDQALDFIVFATEAERLAEQTSLVAYGPMRRSASALMPAEVRAYLPTAEGRREGAIWIDHEWWAANQNRMQARFDAWLRGAKDWVYDFDADDRN
jgi:putative spermidine/putrescine transport system substrate-binding protein